MPLTLNSSGIRDIGRLRDQLRGSQVGTFDTDDWQSYRQVLPSARHQIGKAGTCHIERNNLNSRTHLKRLERRTICFSKCDEMHDAVIKLYVHHLNARRHQL